MTQALSAQRESRALDFAIEYPRQVVLSGQGALGGLACALRASGFTRAFVLSGSNVAASGVTDEVLEALGELSVGVWTRLLPHTPVELVEAAAERVRECRADVIVTVGGGSAHDAGKGVAILLAAGGKLSDHRVIFTPPDRVHVPELRGPRLPLATVSTTLSAAEMTGAAGYVDRSFGFKVIVVDRAVAPRFVVLDPRLVRTTPRAVLAASGCNAVDHCIEAVYSRRHQPVADALALRGLHLLFDSLEKAAGGDLEGIGRCQQGAYLSGLALMHTGLGINHAICHVLDVRGLSHGAANAVIMPHGMRFNLEASRDRQALIANVIGTEVDDAPATVGEFVRRLDLPSRLRELGLPRDDLDGVAADVMHDRQLATNPRPISQTEDVRKILDAAW